MIDPFCLKQFKSSGNARATIDYCTEEFEKKINELYKAENLKEGYAPFCKHLFVKNFTDTLLYYAKITESNRKFLQTVYEARTEKELPVLRRFFSAADVGAERAEYLDIILYSKEQVQKECQAMGNVDPHIDIDYHWAIVSVKAQDRDCEIPMEPITAMRNALGKEEGGSGVPLDRQKYLQSVEFWKDHATVN